MPARSKAQQRLFGMVHAYQKGKLRHAPAKVREIAEHIASDDAKHFAETSHKGLPERKREDEEEKAASYGFFDNRANRRYAMTPYEEGFLTKCAEAGLDLGSSLKLMQKKSESTFWNAAAPLLFAPSRFVMDWSSGYQNRDQSLAQVQAAQNRQAAKEGLQVRDHGLPGTWLGRTANRIFRGKEGFHQYYANVAKKNLEQARYNKAQGAKYNGLVAPQQPAATVATPAATTNNTTAATQPKPQPLKTRTVF